MKPYAESFSTWVIERCSGCGSSSFWRYNDKKTRHTDHLTFMYVLSEGVGDGSLQLLWFVCESVGVGGGAYNESVAPTATEEQEWSHRSVVH